LIYHAAVSDSGVRARIRKKEILFAGNRKLKIYGRLDCRSGKRMKKQNRVFFADEKEATGHGFRPCGHCMRKECESFKDGAI
jgi:methylphosphotriester-DNA--protein-cysteine methyltransferase